jgi:hypothetical protein
MQKNCKGMKQVEFKMKVDLPTRVQYATIHVLNMYVELKIINMNTFFFCFFVFLF